MGIILKTHGAYGAYQEGQDLLDEDWYEGEVLEKEGKKVSPWYCVFKGVATYDYQQSAVDESNYAALVGMLATSPIKYFTHNNDTVYMYHTFIDEFEQEWDSWVWYLDNVVHRLERYSLLDSDKYSELEFKHLNEVLKPDIVRDFIHYLASKPSHLEIPKHPYQTVDGEIAYHLSRDFNDWTFSLNQKEVTADQLNNIFARRYDGHYGVFYALASSIPFHCENLTFLVYANAYWEGDAIFYEPHLAVYTWDEVEEWGSQGALDNRIRVSISPNVTDSPLISIQLWGRPIAQTRFIHTLQASEDFFIQWVQDTITDVMGKGFTDYWVLSTTVVEQLMTMFNNPNNKSHIEISVQDICHKEYGDVD